MMASALVPTEMDVTVVARATTVLEELGTTVPDAIRTLLERTADEGALPFTLIAKSEGLAPPIKIDLPFFAYGVFRPDQLGFFQIKPYVKSVRKAVSMSGNLYLRDGLPILDVEGSCQVTGALLDFKSPQDSSKAYERISALEPEKQYRWDRAEVNGVTANVLLGRSPRAGSVLYDGQEWDGWKDPLFTAALDVVAETLESQSIFEWDLKPSFRLQMAYLLLWSAVERYVALRYHLRGKVMMKVNQLASEPAFATALKEQVNERRPIYRADEPTKSPLWLDRTDPGKAVGYYYQVRSNITHRGKGAVNDHEVVLKSGSELLAIFRAVLAAAKNDAHFGTMTEA